ncbi:hypothetical protein RB213_008507 [Colletotrichum asianum]
MATERPEPVSTPVSRASIRNTGIALIILTTIIVGTRVVLAVINQRKFLPEDGWLIAYYIFVMVLAILYLFIVPAFRLTDLAAGLIEPYDTATEDALFIQQGLFTLWWILVGFCALMPLSRKFSIATLFCLGWVCIAASTVRVTQIGNNGAQPTVPWLALWGTIESAIGKLRRIPGIQNNALIL